MLGHRGCRLSLAYPEIVDMQARAILEAAVTVAKSGVAVSPGGGFGPEGEGYLRLAIVENTQRLRQAVRQIGRCLKQGDGE